MLRDGARCDRSGPLWQKFLGFHRTNPWVYEELKEICSTLRSKGFRKYSTRTIISVLRYRWDIRTGGEDVRLHDGSEMVVKLNNNHSPYYARMLIEENPMFWDFLELRAAEGDPEDAPEKASDILRRRLREARSA